MGTIWSRIEASVRAKLANQVGEAPQPDLEPGLQARTADALWMLARQWQLSEFQGEDAASPVRTRAEVRTTTPTLFVGRGKTRTLPASGVLLEPHVEAEQLGDSPAAFGRNAEAGLHFFRLLDAEGVGKTLRATFRAKYPLAGPAMSPLVDTETQRRMTLLTRRSIDAQRFAATYQNDPQTALPAGITAAQRPMVEAAITAWLAWLASRFLEPGTTTWKSTRMEYDFGLVAAGAQGPVELTAADGYSGGHLDWSSFNIVRDSAQPIDNTTLTVATIEMFPSSVRYRGQPAPRFWQFEDGAVQFAAIAAGPTEPARLVVAEFAMVCGDDWYIMPIPLTTNTLARVTKVDVIDSFGTVVNLRSCAEEDGVNRVWRFFELSGDDSVERGHAPWLYLAPIVVGGSEGRAVERVLFAKDEGANLAWAIERLVEDPLGHPIDRTTAARRSAVAAEKSSAWAYRAESPVPPNWIPLVPVRVGGSAQYKLRRGKMEQWRSDATAGAFGAVLEPGAVCDIREEEVPSEGVVVARAWQSARNSDGTLLVWLGRKKKAGRGEARSGLRYDRIVGTGGDRSFND